ncbi:MAG: hypothetical protein VB948_04485, partial [Pseudomonadales bacterium]
PEDGSIVFAFVGPLALSSKDAHRAAQPQTAIDHAEALMKRLKFNPGDRHQAIIWFNAGKDPAYPFAELAQLCLDESE